MTKQAIFAAGCFWGVEHLFKTLPGVTGTEVGYTGGVTKNPTYEEVCAGNTGHFEAVKVEYNPQKVSYEDLVKFFFEIHDFEQQNGQGPDVGNQYLSVIFYDNASEKQTAKEIIKQLTEKGYTVATQLKPKSEFYPAEQYHQDYYEKNGKTPYCHLHKKIF